jgi:hypothetical protein
MRTPSSDGMAGADSASGISSPRAAVNANEAELGALARRTFHLDGPAHQFDHVLEMASPRPVPPKRRVIDSRP